MIATVMGKFKRPYKLDNGVSGVSGRVSLFLGEYASDSLSGAIGEGEQFIEVKCPEALVDAINVNDELYVELDDKKERIKSALLKTGDKTFTPLEV